MIKRSNSLSNETITTWREELQKTLAELKKLLEEKVTLKQKN